MATSGALAGKDLELARLRFVERLPTREIAKRFDVSHVAIHHWEKKYIADNPQAPAEAERAYIVSQLDEMISRHMDDFRATESEANQAVASVKRQELSKTINQLLQTKAKVLGLDTSVNVNFNFDAPSLPVVAVDIRKDLDALRPQVIEGKSHAGD